MNVGIATVVEFLQKKGYTVEANPNTKISEEQYAILVKEFSTDKNLRLESERFIQERQNKDRNKASVSIEGFEKQQEKPKSEDVIKTVVPEDARPKFKPVGKIDLDKLNGRKPEKVEKEPEQKQEVPVVERPVVKPEVKKEPEKREPEVKKEEVVIPPVSVVEPTPVVVEPVVVPEPVVETKPVEVEKVVEEVKKEEPKVVETAPVKAEEHKEEKKVETAQAEVTPVAEKAPEDDGVFKIRQPELGAKINVIGQIDLAALNQSTRPKKKSKEEKKMKLLSIEYIPGVDFEPLGIVKGTVVQTKNVGRDFMAGMKTLVGGEIVGYTEMLNEARQIATKRMVDEAKEMDADAVIGVKYGSSQVMSGAAEVIAYGTAVKYK